MHTHTHTTFPVKPGRTGTVEPEKRGEKLQNHVEVAIFTGISRLAAKTRLPYFYYL